MSNIYIQEPPTEGKVLLETTAGDIDIELWSREAPKACRNFVQLCMEGYYDGTIFHRLVKSFIVQGGDPTGTGAGGNSIWGKPFKDEFHSRLRFVRRGLVAMANAGKDDNGSQFFFTLGATPELQGKHTIFAKIGGDTIYNMLKLEEGLTDEDEKPLYPHKISKTKVLSNPFPDIVPRETIKRVKEDKKERNKSKSAATKNYKLLSFGEEAEEDEEEVDEVNKKFSGKSKSSHDLAKDPKLSSQVAVEPSSPKNSKHKEFDKDDDESEDEQNDSTKVDEMHDDKSIETDVKVQSVRDKLKSKSGHSEKDSSKRETESSSKSISKSKTTLPSVNDDDDDEEYYLGKEEAVEKKRKLEELRKEYRDLKKTMKREKESKDEEDAQVAKEEEDKARKLAADNNVIKEYLDEQEKYKQVKASAAKKGDDREAQTLALLAKFKSKIETAKETFGDSDIPSADVEEGEQKEEEEENADDISWLARKLHYDNKGEVLAKDANTKSDDWFDIYDPRSSLAKRRREKGQEDSKEKKRAKINM